MTERPGADRSALAARLLATFLDELDEQLRALDADLLALERDPSDAEHPRSVFRVAHTLKGASRAAGVHAIEEVCHALETMCAVARDSGAPLASSQISLLFAGSDALADAGKLLREGRDASSSPVVVELLQQLRRRASVTEPAGRALPVPTSASAPALAAVGPVSDRRSPELELDRRASDPANVAEAATVAAGSALGTRDQVRVGTQQLDSLVTVAGELLGMTGMIGDRPADAEKVAESIRAWRAEWRRGAGVYRRSLAQSDASPAIISAMAAVDDHLAQLDGRVAGARPRDWERRADARRDDLSARRERPPTADAPIR